MGETEVTYLLNESQIRYNQYYWEFNFENLKFKKMDSYVNIVKEFKEKKCITLEQIFKSKSLTDELKRELNFGGNEINRTSVILLHRPTVNNALVLCNRFNCTCWDCWRECCVMYDHTICSTVLTGDVKLEDNEGFYILHSEPGEQTNKYFVVQFPHHGSKENNIQYFSNLWTVTSVLSYGLTNRYGHPHREVLQQLGNVSCVHERQAFDYQILIKDLKVST